MWHFPVRKAHERGAYVDACVAAETLEAGGCELPDTLSETLWCAGPERDVLKEIQWLCETP